MWFCILAQLVDDDSGGIVMVTNDVENSVGLKTIQAGESGGNELVALAQL